MSWNCPHCGTLMKFGWQRDAYLGFLKCENCSSTWILNVINGFDRGILTEIPNTYYKDKEEVK